jgi:hypothetical protein
MENENNQFNEYAEKHNAAFEAFNSVYEAKHPPPIKGKADRSDWFIPAVLLILVACSVIVSGSRTVEEFGGGPVGYAAFVMVEIAIIAFAFYITKNNVGSDRVEYTRHMAWAGVIDAFVVAIAANLADVLKKHGIYVSPEVTTMLNVLVAVSAPTLAFISGHILAVEYLKFTRRNQEADKRFNEQTGEYQEAKLRSWQSQQGRWGIRREVEPVQPVNPVNFNKINKRERTSKQLERAMEWLIANPGNLSRASRELVEDIGVSHVTIYKAQQIIKAENGYTNGHAQ